MAQRDDFYRAYQLAALETIEAAQIRDRARRLRYLAFFRGTGASGEEDDDESGGAAAEPCNSDSQCSSFTKCEIVDGVCHKFKGECLSDVNVGNYCHATDTGPAEDPSCCASGGGRAGVYQDETA